jgi:hypothetical protein
MISHNQLDVYLIIKIKKELVFKLRIHLTIKSFINSKTNNLLKDYLTENILSASLFYNIATIFFFQKI